MTRHLTDEQLFDLETGRAADSGHLTGCHTCQTRLDDLAALLSESVAAASAEAALHFPAERLTRQRDRILARIDDVTATGRLIPFPHTPDRAVGPARTHHRSRWVAAAAVAGLVVGLLGGRLTRDLGLHVRGQVAGDYTAADRRPPAPLAPTALGPAEEELLGQVEVVFEGRGPAALQPLDLLTPVAWDVRD